MLPKYAATGKARFSSIMEARYIMFSLKWAYKRKKDMYGKRIKHRQGRPVQRRGYQCAHCDGYHITHWKAIEFDNYLHYLDERLGLKQFHLL